MSHENDWVTVASTYFLPEADVLQSVLEDHGIPVFLRGEHTASLGAPLSLLDRGVRIQVPRSDQARAEEILRAQTASETGSGDEYDADPTNNPEIEDDLPSGRGSKLAWVVMTGLGLVWLIFLLAKR